MGLKNTIYQIINNNFPNLLFRRISYSQDGEDLLLTSFYEGKKNYKGFYIDIGAHHPFRFSNTAFFYKKGWNGINVEPTPTLFKEFIKFRKKDINLNFGIGNGEKLIFYIFNEGALNTFDKDLALERDNSHNGKYKIINKIEIQTYSLSEMLDKHLPKNRKIDLLTIDVEGLDFVVLQSNNWDKFIPEFIMIECDTEIETINTNEIYQFLKNKNYSMIGKTLRTSLFKLNK